MGWPQETCGRLCSWYFTPLSQIMWPGAQEWSFPLWERTLSPLKCLAGSSGGWMLSHIVYIRACCHTSWRILLCNLYINRCHLFKWWEKATPDCLHVRKSQFLFLLKSLKDSGCGEKETAVFGFSLQDGNLFLSRWTTLSQSPKMLPLYPLLLCSQRWSRPGCPLSIDETHIWFNWYLNLFLSDLCHFYTLPLWLEGLLGPG